MRKLKNAQSRSGRKSLASAGSAVTRNEAFNHNDTEGMFLIRILECAIVISITHCNSLANSNQNQRLPNGSPIAPSSPITVGDSGQPNVTFSDKSSIDRVKFENQREFPPSARNSDTPYRGSNDYDYESMFPANDDVPSLPECILSRSEFYLSWWVNEDGTLKVNPTNRSGSAGFADLSLTFHSEDMMIKHVAQMTTDNPSDVIAMKFHCRNR